MENCVRIVWRINKVVFLVFLKTNGPWIDFEMSPIDFVYVIIL